MAKRWNIEQKIKAFESFKKNLPKKIGNAAKNHFLMSWDKKSFSDGSIGSDPWAARKKETAKTKGRALLVERGHLRRSIQVKQAVWNKQNPKGLIRVGSYGIEYAKYHNRGGRHLPKRQFIGESRVLTKRINIIAQRELRKILQ